MCRRTILQRNFIWDFKNIRKYNICDINIVLKNITNALTESKDNFSATELSHYLIFSKIALQ